MDEYVPQPRYGVSQAWVGRLTSRWDHINKAILRRRLEEAKAAYQEVVKLDPRNQTVLAFLGVTYHLLGDIDSAIVKYHEVGVACIHRLSNYALIHYVDTKYGSD